MKNSAYNIVSESVILTEFNAINTGLGVTVAGLGSWSIYIGTLMKKTYKRLQTAETREDAINILNDFYTGFKLSADKLDNPKETTYWKRLWSRKAVVYHTLNQEDWKEKLLKEFKSEYRSCFVSGGIGIGVGALSAGYGLTH